MLHKENSGEPEFRSRAGPIDVRALTRIAVVIAAGLGLAACAGPYNDGYSHPRTKYQASPNYYDGGYDRRRGTAYRQYPYASPVQQRWDYRWWRTDYSRDRYYYDR